LEQKKNVPTSLKPPQNDLIYLKINCHFQIDALKYSNNNQTLHTYLNFNGRAIVGKNRSARY
jgi:hypothetical protein